MGEVRRCALCGRHFHPERRNQKRQKYCSRRCAKKAKRDRDREHKRLYRDTGLGHEQRRRESEKRREQLGWAEYMRYWRKAEPDERAGQERQRQRRYYAKHRDEIVAKRRAQRAARRALRKACSH